jgi:hypothetical protein
MLGDIIADSRATSPGIRILDKRIQEKTMTTLAQTIAECRHIPRSSRVRQGFPRLNDFARHVYRLREERNRRLASNPKPSDIAMASPERVRILARLARIIEDDAGLRLAARRAAVDWSYSGYRPLGRGWTPPMEMVWTVPWRETDQRRYQGLPITTPRIIGDHGHGSFHRYQRSTRRIAVPAAWLLARLREQASANENLSMIVREVQRASLLRRHAAVIRCECETAWVLAWRAWCIHTAQSDPDAPDTLGWRIWDWDAKRQLLRSPHVGTLWHSAELRVERWDESSVLRGRAGIHARRMPRNWLKAEWGDHDGPVMRGPHCLRGIVERFGRYVLGTIGWRAEWVVIRKLRAPTTEIGLALESAYPEVEVIYEDR